MRVSEVILVPAFSNKAKLGNYSGRYCQYDALRAYMDPLCEHLDEDRIKVKIQDKDVPIFPNSLVLYLSVGWSLKPSGLNVNYSKVSYNPKTSRRFSEITIEAISDWGKCHVDLSHTCKETIKHQNKLLEVDGTMGLGIEPFILNGPRIDDYMRSAPFFGKTLASAIFEFLFSRGEQPKMMRVQYTNAVR